MRKKMKPGRNAMKCGFESVSRTDRMRPGVEGSSSVRA